MRPATSTDEPSKDESFRMKSSIGSSFALYRQSRNRNGPNPVFSMLGNTSRFPSDEDFHRTGSRFEPEGERARQAAGEDYGRPAESEYAAEHESARTA